MAETLGQAGLGINASVPCLQKTPGPTEFLSAIACIFGDESATSKKEKKPPQVSLWGLHSGAAAVSDKRKFAALPLYPVRIANH